MTSKPSLIKPKRALYDEDKSVLAYEAEWDIGCIASAVGLSVVLIGLFICPFTAGAVVAYVLGATLGAPAGAISVAMSCFA